MIAGVLLFIVVPLAVAAALFVVRRLQTLAAFIATGVAAALGAGALWLPLDQVVVVGGRQVSLGAPVEVLGRQLIITGADSVVLGGLFLAASGLFMVGWRASQGSSFFPLGLAILGLLSSALVARPFLYASLFLTIAAVLATIFFESGTSGQTRGALRFLVLMTLALPAFMIASWLLDLYALNPTDVGLARNIMLAMTAGFVLLLGVVPFHIWIRPVVEESSPVAAVFVLTVFNSVAWFLLFDVLQEYPWLFSQQDMFRILQFLGLLTAAVGGLLAFSSYDFVHVLSYGVLADYGCSLIVLGARIPAGLSAVILAALARPVSLAILALGLAMAREQVKSTRFEKLAGTGWLHPWTAAALVVGGFSLAGIPPLAGFLGRWSEARVLAATQPVYALVVLGVTLGVAAGALRGLDYILQPPSETAKALARPREPRLTAALVVLCLAVVVGFGLFPGVVESGLRAVVSSYTFFSGP
jgi:formate hydrogenlyase subunit 3/multisubunit Na+/H+ antiporter MnhD subunit